MSGRVVVINATWQPADAQRDDIGLNQVTRSTGRRRLHCQPSDSGDLLPTLDAYAIELKSSHEAWKEQLSDESPGSDPSQLASQALEIALKELEDLLDTWTPSNHS